jgi:glutaredoxin
MAKDFFQKNSVQFSEYNVGTDLEKRQEMIEMSGQMGVPVITVGDKLIIGFNKAKLTELLGIQPAV